MVFTVQGRWFGATSAVQARRFDSIGGTTAMTDLLDTTTGPVGWDDDPEDDVRTPLIPIAMLLVTAVTAIALVAVAVSENAGQTDEISSPAVLAWLVGSLVGLLIFAWFGLLDSVRRSSGVYSEPSWGPRTVAGVLAVVGWLAGSVAAFVIAESVARR